MTGPELADDVPLHLPSELDDALAAGQRALSAGEYGRARQTFAEVERVATAHGLVCQQAWARASLGEAALRYDGPREAIAHFRDAEEILRDEPLATRARVIARRAFCLFRLGDLDEAVRLLETTLVRLDADGCDPSALVVLHAALIPPYAEMGSMDRAASSAGEALHRARDVDDPEVLARLHLAVGRVWAAQGRMAEAEAAVVRAQELYRRLGYEGEVARCHWSLGYILARAGQLKQAVAELERARAVYRNTCVYGDFARATGELALTLYRAGELDEAERLAREAVGLLADDDVDVRAEACFVQGLVAAARGKPWLAEALLREAHTLYGRAGAQVELARVSLQLGELLMERGETEEALDILRGGLVAVEKLG